MLHALRTNLVSAVLCCIVPLWGCSSLLAGCCSVLCVTAWSAASCAAERPNIVLIFADDLGYGDLGCYGETRWKTPNLDSIARDGVRFTDFHVSQPVCSASRASLLTGCYANRIGIHGALFPASNNGIHADEVLLPELLSARGYRTCMVGKWHLGHHEPFLPLQHGFERYLGLPYSNDMWPYRPGSKPGSYPSLPLIRNGEVIDDDVDAKDQALLTQRYTDFALEFVRQSRREPFFLYYAHTFPHVPLFAHPDYQGRSGAGLYGDVLEEFDDAVGRILKALEETGVAENTLVIFTSDNGPWLTYGNHAGTAGPLREGKGTVYEGGVRVPMVAKWPGRIPAGSIQHESAMTIDLLPTIAKLVDAPLPEHPIDGLDIGDLLLAKPGAKCPHEVFYHYYRTGELQAVRSGPWKMILPHDVLVIDRESPGSDGKPGKSTTRKIVSPELYRLDFDLGETKDIAADQPEVVKRLEALAEQAREELGDSLRKVVGRGVRAAGQWKP